MLPILRYMLSTCGFLTSVVLTGAQHLSEPDFEAIYKCVQGEAGGCFN